MNLSFQSVEGLYCGVTKQGYTLEIGYQMFLIAFGLGLLGFVEPCTIGTHMLFLGSQSKRPIEQRLSAAAVFVVGRVLVMGGFGTMAVVVGQRLIGVQTGGWLVFGTIYLIVGLTILFHMDRVLRRRLKFAPARWKAASNPMLQGLAFGLNVPACAAPILFGLIGVAAVSNSAVLGFLLMATFAMALSLPLIPLAAAPRLALPFERFADWLRQRRWLLGAIFLLVGLWSLWFGLFVDPVDWSAL